MSRRDEIQDRLTAISVEKRDLEEELKGLGPDEVEDPTKEGPPAPTTGPGPSIAGHKAPAPPAKDYPTAKDRARPEDKPTKSEIKEAGSKEAAKTKKTPAKAAKKGRKGK